MTTQEKSVTKKVAKKAAGKKAASKKSKVKPVRIKSSDVTITAKLVGTKYDPKTTVLSATAVVTIDTPVGSLTLLEKKVSAKVPLKTEVQLFKVKAKSNQYDIDLIGNVKLNTIKTGTLTVTAKGKVVVLFEIPVKASYSYNFSIK